MKNCNLNINFALQIRSINASLAYQIIKYKNYVWNSLRLRPEAKV